MRHVEKALLSFNLMYGQTSFIKIENATDEKGVSPKISFEIQSDPISEVGVNGVQCLDMIKYNLELLKSLNDAFPCRENSISITKLQEAIMWQEQRTKDREKRGVEGVNKL